MNGWSLLAAHCGKQGIAGLTPPEGILTDFTIQTHFFPNFQGKLWLSAKKTETKTLFHITFKASKKCFSLVPTTAFHGITYANLHPKMTNFMEYQQKRLNSLMLGSHESKKYCCMQKISSLAQKMAILGLILFSDKIMILVWGFQPLCIGHTTVGQNAKSHSEIVLDVILLR